MDIRVLLSGLRTNVPQIKTQKPIDVVIFDKKYSSTEISSFITSKVANISEGHKIVTVDCEVDELQAEIDSRDSKVYKHVCLGGTFDRLHVAHKLLLSEAILRTSDKITVGVTEENMTHSKTTK